MLKPIIKKVKKFVPYVSPIINGVKAIRNGWKCIKNTYKTAKNFIMNRPYKKYWEKTKNYGKAAFKQVKKYVVNSTPFKKVYDIYKTGVKWYKYCKTGFNIAKNSYNYIKSYANGEDTSKYKDNLKKNFSSKYNPFSKFFNKGWNNTIKTVKEKYQTYKSYYDKGKYYYDKFREFKNKIFLYKNNILNKINEIQNEEKNSVSTIQYKVLYKELCPICHKWECPSSLMLKEKIVTERIEIDKNIKNKKISSLINSISSDFDKFPYMSHPIYHNIKKALNDIKKGVNNDYNYNGKDIYNNLKNEFINLFGYEYNFNYLKQYF